MYSSCTFQQIYESAIRTELHALRCWKTAKKESQRRYSWSNSKKSREKSSEQKCFNRIRQKQCNNDDVLK